MSDSAVWFVEERFDELSNLLMTRGWDPVERGDLSEWDEGRRVDPVMGVVRIRGVRELTGMGTVTFTVKEWWAHPPVDGTIYRQGVVLAGYHYMAVSLASMVRYCFDPVRHPDVPFHVHPDGDEDLHAAPPVTVEEALAQLEQRLAEEVYAGVEGTLNLDEEDLADDVFAED